jgi:hypothetical protein
LGYNQRNKEISKDFAANEKTRDFKDRANVITHPPHADGINFPNWSSNIVPSLPTIRDQQRLSPNK